MSIGFIFIWLVAFIIPTVVPESIRQALFTRFIGISIWQVGLVAGLVLVLVDVLLIAIALARFQRARLILD